MCNVQPDLQNFIYRAEQDRKSQLFQLATGIKKFFFLLPNNQAFIYILKNALIVAILEACFLILDPVHVPNLFFFSFKINQRKVTYLTQGMSQF